MPERRDVFVPESETKKKLTPREHLEKFLEGEKAGSPRIMAIAHRAMQISDVSHLHWNAKNAPDSGDPFYDSYKGQVDARRLSLEMVGMRIEEESFGENADEYLSAVEQFEEEIFRIM